MTKRVQTPRNFGLVQEPARDVLTLRLDGVLLGLPVLSTTDVLKPMPFTPVPLAPIAVVGVMNLRGRIVTMLDLRVHLGFQRRADKSSYMSVVVEKEGAPYALTVDTVEDVIAVDPDDVTALPSTLDPRLQDVASGVCRLENELMVLLDLERLLDFELLMVA